MAIRIGAIFLLIKFIKKRVVALQAEMKTVWRDEKSLTEPDRLARGAASYIAVLIKSFPINF